MMSLESLGYSEQETPYNYRAFTKGTYLNGCDLVLWPDGRVMKTCYGFPEGCKDPRSYQFWEEQPTQEERKAIHDMRSKR